MAREVLTIAGTVIGAYFGQPQLGFIIGSMVGNAVDPVKIKGPSLGDAKVQTTQEGAPIPRVWGRAAIAGTVIDRGEPIRVTREHQEGKGGGPVTVEERELMTFAILISEPIEAILRIWENDKLVYNVLPDSTIIESSQNLAGKFRFYNGSETQLPDPSLEAIHGVGDTPFYRGTAYVVFPNYDYTEKGMAIPRYLFEVASASVANYPPWWLHPALAPNDDSIEFSADATAWGSASTRSPKIDQLLRTALTDTTIVAMNGYDVEVTSIVDAAPMAPTIVTPNNMPTDAENIVIDGMLFVYGTTDAFSYSLDGGYVWLDADTPEPGEMVALNRLGSGRWIAMMVPTAGGEAYWYTDALLPTGGWVSATIGAKPNSGAHFICYDGSGDAFQLTNGGNVRRTSNGDSWTSYDQLGDASSFTPGSAKFVSSGGAWLVAGDQATEGALVHRSTDNGATWAKIIIDASPGASTCYQLSAGDDGLVVGSFSTGTYISDDGGLGWVQADSDGLATYSGYSSTIADPGSGTYLSTILTELHERVGITAAEIEVSDHTATYVAGFVYGSVYNTADAIRELGKTHLFDSFAADLKIRYPARGGASAFALTEDELLEDPDILERRQEIELPRKFHLGYQDYALNYATVKATSLRTSPDIRVIGESGLQTSVIMSGTEAIQLSDKLHKVIWVDLEGEFTLKVPDNFAYLTPTDCGTVTFRGITKRVRIERVETAAGVMTLTCRHDRASSYTSDLAPVIIRDPLPVRDPLAGDTLWRFINIPAIQDSHDLLGYYIAGAGEAEGWNGYQLERSIDAGETYVYVGQFGGAVLGKLLAELGNASRYFTDYQNELRVHLFGPSDTLEAATRAQVLRSANAMAVINNDGTAEIIQFQNMTEESANVWVGTTLLRGRKNTTASSHPEGSWVAMLSSASFVTATTALIGADLTHRPTSIGSSPEDSNEITDSLAPVLSQTEWAPCYLRLSRNGNDLTATWSPRPRLGDSAYPVESVNFLGYRVTLTKGANTVTFDQTSTTFTYDTSGLGSPTIDVSIRGINRYTGVGDALTGAL